MILSLLLLLLLRAQLWSITLRSNLLDFLNHFLSSICRSIEFLFNFGFHYVKLLLLTCLEPFQLLQDFLVVELHFFSLGIFVGSSATEFAFDLGFFGIEFLLAYLSFDLRDLQDLLVMGLGLLLDCVKFLNDAFLSISMSLGTLIGDFFFFSSFL